MMADHSNLDTFNELVRFNNGEANPKLQQRLAHNADLRFQQAVVSAAQEAAEDSNPVHLSHASTVTEEAIALFLMGDIALSKLEASVVARALRDCPVCLRRGAQVRQELLSFGAHLSSSPVLLQHSVWERLKLWLGSHVRFGGAPLIAAVFSVAIAVGIPAMVQMIGSSGLSSPGGLPSRGVGQAYISMMGTLYKEVGEGTGRWRPAGKLPARETSDINAKALSGHLPQCQQSHRLDITITGNGEGCLTLWRQSGTEAAERLYLRENAVLGGGLEHIPRPVGQPASQPTGPGDWLDLSQLTGTQTFLAVLSPIAQCSDSATPEWLAEILSSPTPSLPVASIACEAKL